MKKRLLIPLIILSFCIPVTSLEVDVDEIKTKKVEFQNYRGRPRKVDPVRGIRMIGSKLGYGSRKTGPNRWYRYHRKYSILRAISQEEKDKFSADIFSIDPAARVNHIKNVRRITIAYLQSMYGYSYRDARALTYFVTYYNAVHRGDMPYLKTKYKKVVLKHLNSGNAGISTKYYEWPGRTRMIIPLTDVDKRGKIRLIDPFIIADEKTRKLSRKDDDNLKERKDLIDLQKRKLEDDKSKTEEDKKKLEEDKKRLEEEKKKTIEKKEKLKEEEDKIKKEKDRLKEEKKTVKDITDPKKKEEKQKEIKKKEDTLKKKEDKIKRDKKTVKKEEKQTEKKEDKIKEEEDTIKKKEDDITKKEDLIKKEEKELKEDTTKKDKEDKEKKEKEETPSEDDLKKKEDELAKKEKDLDKREEKLRDKQLDKRIFALKLYYLKIRQYLSGGHYNNEMYMINPKTRKILFKSPITNICGKRYDVFSDGVVVITHLGNHRSGHRLTLLDRNTLKPVRNGTDDVFWRSFIEIRDGFIYVIMEERGNFYLGKYDKNFKLVGRSSDWINENTFISFFEDYIYINRKDKKIMVLNKNDLSVVDIIKP